MSQELSLKDADRKVFHSTINDGLWDIFLGLFFLEFAIAPHLSESLGDFWSSAIFLPVWAVVFLLIRWVRRTVLEPRLGVVKFGQSRIAKLKRFSVLMLAFNLIMLILGFWAAISFDRTSGEAIPYMFSLILLAGFSLAAFFLEFNRLYFYGLMVAAAPIIGEWLWNNANATHHGYPITFGVAAGIMILIGITIFVQVLRSTSLPEDLIEA